MDINNKVAIVTGGIRGIGFATVQHFLRHGAQYVGIFDLFNLNSQIVQNSLKTLGEEFARIRFGYYRCDVVKHEEFISQYNDVTNSINSVDILVNNAGVCNDNKPDLTIAVNVTAVVKCTMYAIERMGTHKANKGGVVVNIGSIFGLKNTPILPIYSASKTAVAAFVRSMKLADECVGVRILCLCPGITKTVMGTEVGRTEFLDFISDKFTTIPVPYTQDPNNVAAAIVEIAKKGKPGDVWLAHNDEPPFNTKTIQNVEELRTEF